MPTIDIDDVILADLRALATIAPVPVHYVDEAPSDDRLPVQNGLVVPYIVFHPGLPATTGLGKGIINSTKDPVETYCIIECVAPNTTIAKQLGDAINDRVMGRKYPGASEMKLSRASRYEERVDDRTPPSTYRMALMYNYIVNL